MSTTADPIATFDLRVANLRREVLDLEERRERLRAEAVEATFAERPKRHVSKVQAEIFDLESKIAPRLAALTEAERYRQVARRAASSARLDEIAVARVDVARRWTTKLTSLRAGLVSSLDTSDEIARLEDEDERLRYEARNLLEAGGQDVGELPARVIGGAQPDLIYRIQAIDETVASMKKNAR